MDAASAPRCFSSQPSSANKSRRWTLSVHRAPSFSWFQNRAQPSTLDVLGEKKPSYPPDPSRGDQNLSYKIESTSCMHKMSHPKPLTSKSESCWR